MAQVSDDVRVTADRLLDALDVYDRFVDGWPDERGSVPSEVEAYLADWGAGDSDTRPGVALATRVRDLYQRARKAEATTSSERESVADVIGRKSLRKSNRYGRRRGGSTGRDTGPPRKPASGATCCPKNCVPHSSWR